MTKDDIIRMARKAGIVFDERAYPFYERFFHAAYAAGAASEREACEEVCETESSYWSEYSDGHYVAGLCGIAIRARGQA